LRKEGGEKGGKRGDEGREGEEGKREGRGREREGERENTRMGKCFLKHKPNPQFQTNPKISRKIAIGYTIASLTQPSGVSPVLQITIECAERGLLLLRIRDEARMRIAAYQTLYESSLAFAVSRKILFLFTSSIFLTRPPSFQFLSDSGRKAYMTSD
jgi:hypothetical protein